MIFPLSCSIVQHVIEQFHIKLCNYLDLYPTENWNPWCVEFVSYHLTASHLSFELHFTDGVLGFLDGIPAHGDHHRASVGYHVLCESRLLSGARYGIFVDRVHEASLWGFFLAQGVKPFLEQTWRRMQQWIHNQNDPGFQ